MSRTRSRCTQTEVSRIFKAAAAAGVNVRLELGVDGKIVVIAGKPSETHTVAGTNPWDEVLVEDHERH